MWDLLRTSPGQLAAKAAALDMIYVQLEARHRTREAAAQEAVEQQRLDAWQHERRLFYDQKKQQHRNQLHRLHQETAQRRRQALDATLRHQMLEYQQRSQSPGHRVSARARQELATIAQDISAIDLQADDSELQRFLSDSSDDNLDSEAKATLRSLQSPQPVSASVSQGPSTNSARSGAASPISPRPEMAPEEDWLD
ncbi:hypothetical protein H4R34_000697 [Dimargaris verticillata]|uniref:Uncharacterized protein n=1 Tax=Dimargaris verticillata TaxID=2761393 RepID=A0A9W8EB13_9FUNG|nr:hypothetical protein H4R34_000697 [Dimargaris verticillata]